MVAGRGPVRRFSAKVKIWSLVRLPISDAVSFVLVE